MARQFLPLHSHAVQFVLGSLIFRIVQTLPLCILDMSHEMQLSFAITTTCVAVVVLQPTLDADILFWPLWRGLGIVRPLLAKASGASLAAPLSYKISVDKYMCPANFDQKHPNSDELTTSILESRPGFGHCPGRWSEKKNLCPTEGWTACGVLGVFCPLDKIACTRSVAIYNDARLRDCSA